LSRNISQRNQQKENKPFKIKWLYECFGISKQAFHKRIALWNSAQNQELQLLQMVDIQRKQISTKLGGKKLYYNLKPMMEEKKIKIGRDKFYCFLRANSLLVPKIRSFHITTNSKHHFFKYKNLVQGKVPTRPEQLWVSDITYIKTQNGHNYLALVTDAYSKQIMGYKIDNHMRTSLCSDALAMAIKNRKYSQLPLIHHSDRGFQYCNPEYTNYAEKNGLTISMTEKYDPYENAVAERINRTLKYEFGLKEVLKDTSLAKKMVAQGIERYNVLRPHLSLNMLTPYQAHLKQKLKYKSYKKEKTEREILVI